MNFIEIIAAGAGSVSQQHPCKILAFIYCINIRQDYIDYSDTHKKYENCEKECMYVCLFACNDQKSEFAFEN